MTNDLAIFNFQDQQVRTALLDGEPVFVAKDVLTVLGYSESTLPARAIAHVPEEWRGLHPIHTPGGFQDMHVLSEQGLYFFLGRSDKPAALPFQKFVAGEVMPSIRKTGSYTAIKAPKPTEQLREARGVFHESLRIAKLLRLEGNHAQIKAMQITRAKTGIDVGELFGVTALIADTQSNHLTVTEIGKRLVPARSGSAVNLMLMQLGFQAKDGKVWVGTDEGRPHWIVIEQARKFSDGSATALHWFPSVIPMLQASLDAMGA